MTDTIEQKKRAIQDEIDKLREEYQVELPRRIAEARGQGDLSENAEFHAARERQSFVRARIAQLTRYLGQISETTASAVDEKKIGLGSVVVLLDRNSNTRCEYTLVHPVEADADEGKISMRSPVGAALMDRTAGEEVAVTVPAGEKKFFIEKVTTLHGHVTTA